MAEGDRDRRREKEEMEKAAQVRGKPSSSSSVPRVAWCFPPFCALQGCLVLFYANGEGYFGSRRAAVALGTAVTLVFLFSGGVRRPGGGVKGAESVPLL